MRYFLSGLSGVGFQAIGGAITNINTSSISSVRCYEPNQVLGMVLEEVDARGTSRRVFVDRLSASDRPLPHPGTQSATSGSTTRTIPGALLDTGSSTALNRRFNGALPTVSVAQIRVNTTLLPDSSNRHLLKTYFTADAARSPVVLCVPATANTGSISSARCYEPGQVLGMVLEEVDARGTSRRVFVDRLIDRMSPSVRPLPQPGTQSATSGSTTRTLPRNLPGASSSTPLNRRFNGALPTVSVEQIRVNTTRRLKTYFTADAARSPVVLCVFAPAKKPVQTRKVPDIIVRKGFGKIDKEKIIRKIGKTSIWTIPATAQTALANAEAARREAERQAELARQAQTDQEQQAALDRMAVALANAERAATEALAAANAAAARAQSAEERAVAAEAKVSAQTTVAVVEEVKDVAADVGVTSDGNGNVVIDTEVTPTPPEVTPTTPEVTPTTPEVTPPSEVAPEQPGDLQIGPSLPPKKSKAPLLLLAAAVGGYFWLKG